MTKATADAECFRKLAFDLVRCEAVEAVIIGDLKFTSTSVSHDTFDPFMYQIKSQGVRAAIVTDLGNISKTLEHIFVVSVFWFSRPTMTWIC
jgi:phosphoribosyl 1,2-cyclic phosphodiesterase